MTELACRWCGKTLAEHVDAHPPGVAARVPCGLLKSQSLAAIDRGGLPGLARELEQLRKEQR